MNDDEEIVEQLRLQNALLFELVRGEEESKDAAVTRVEDAAYLLSTDYDGGSGLVASDGGDRR